MSTDKLSRLALHDQLISQLDEAKAEYRLISGSWGGVSNSVIPLFNAFKDADFADIVSLEKTVESLNNFLIEAQSNLHNFRISFISSAENEIYLRSIRRTLSSILDIFSLAGQEVVFARAIAKFTQSGPTIADCVDTLTAVFDAEATQDQLKGTSGASLSFLEPSTSGTLPKPAPKLHRKTIQGVGGDLRHQSPLPPHRSNRPTIHGIAPQHQSDAPSSTSINPAEAAYGSIQSSLQAATEGVLRASQPPALIDSEETLPPPRAPESSRPAFSADLLVAYYVASKARASAPVNNPAATAATVLDMAPVTSASPVLAPVTESTTPPVSSDPEITIVSTPLVPAVKPFQGAFTSPSNQRDLLPVYTPENPAPSTSIEEQSLNDSLPPTVRLPSDYMTSRSAQAPHVSAPPIVSDSPAPFTAPFWQARGEIPLYSGGSTTPPSSPSNINTAIIKPHESGIEIRQKGETTQIIRQSDLKVSRGQSSTRGTLAVALGGLALTIFGALGASQLGGSGSKSTISPSSSSSSSASASSAPSVSPKAPEATPAKEQAKTYQNGVFRVDAHHPEYSKLMGFLHSNGLYGVEAITRDLASLVSIPMLQNPADIAKATAAKTKFLTGQETEVQLRQAAFGEFLRLGQTNNIGNDWVKNVYFAQIIKQYNKFLATGSWPTNSRDAQLYYNAFQKVGLFMATPGVKGYAPDLDESHNPALSLMNRAAPTFYTVFKEASQDMAAETDPAKLPTYNDFGQIKQNVCDRIAVKGKNPKMSAEFQGGIRYMHASWCAEGAANSPSNYLNQSLRATVEIKSGSIPTNSAKPTPETIPPKPAGDIHNSIVPINLYPSPTDTSASPAHTKNEFKPTSNSGTIAANHLASLNLPANDPIAAEAKSGLWSRFTSKLKSFFSFDIQGELAKIEKAEKLAQMSAQELENSLPTKADLPMNSWKDTLKGFFGV